MPLTLSPKVRYPDPVKARSQVLRNRYYHARRYRASQPDPLLPGISMEQVAINLTAFNRQMEELFGRENRPLPPFPTDRTRCEACGLLDDDCRCTWNSR